MPNGYQSIVKTAMISVAVIIAALILAIAAREGTHYIGDAIGNGLSFIGMNLSPTATERAYEYNEFMSEYEAAAFLCISADDFPAFIQSGELDGTYTTMQGHYLFSKAKLTAWIEKRIENAQTK